MNKIEKNSAIKIEKLIPGGQALGSLLDGKKIFFWNALPGEIVTEFVITKNKTHYTEAVAIKIKDPSIHRVHPKDDCYLSTSPWQILDYDYELEQKNILLQEMFDQENITLKNDFNPCLTNNKDFFYRNKMEYALYWDNGEQKIKPAFHQRGSHRKIPITKSSIERPEIFQKATEIIDNLNINHEEARKYQSLLLRCDQQGNVGGGLYENGKPHPIFDNLNDTILGHEYSYSPNGFFQINLPVYEMALQEIKKHIVTDEVIDLYAGVGTIGLSVARNKNLTLVECDKYAFKELQRNASSKQNDYELIPKTLCCNSEDALDYIAPGKTIIVDPPRAGCHKKLLEKFLEQTPKTLIYLSCNPTTQARDVKILQEKYQITHVQSFNFFPRTPHIENLVVLMLK